MTVYIIVLIAIIITNTAAFFQIKSNSASLKSILIEKCRSVDRGLTESEDDRDEILKLFEKLEKMNPTKKSLTSPLLNDVWDLEYTTSDSILGRGDFPRVGPILQMLNNN